MRQFEAHLGTKVITLGNKSGNVKTVFSLERGHTNQAFQGLCFAIVHHLLIHIVETLDVYRPPDAQFTLCSSHGPIWDPNLQYFRLQFSDMFLIEHFFSRRNLVSAHGAILKVRGEHGSVIIQEETWRRHIGSIFELPGKILGWFWDSFGSHSDTQEAPRWTQEAPGAPGVKK